jgi:hypothetical protein
VFQGESTIKNQVTFTSEVGFDFAVISLMASICACVCGCKFLGGGRGQVDGMGDIT